MSPNLTHLNIIFCCGYFNAMYDLVPQLNIQQFIHQNTFCSLGQMYKLSGQIATQEKLLFFYSFTFQNKELHINMYHTVII